jgi:protein dithiol:quinone oxidoreductase
MSSVLLTLRGRRPAFNVLAAVVCFSLLGFALYSQHFLGFKPCPLCIFQRIAVIALGVAFLAAALVPARARMAGMAVSILIGLVAVAGAVVSARHLYLQSLPPRPPGEIGGCGAPLGTLWNVNPASEFLAKVFRGTGDCSQIDWSFLGVPMPGWVLIWVLALGTAGMLVNWRTRAG